MDKNVQNNQKSLVLASSSESRRKQLSRLGISFRTQAPEIDETPEVGEDAESLVRRLSVAKAQAVAPHFPGALIISGDQTASFQGHFLNKPGSRERAIDQLARLQGQRIEFVSGLCVLDTESGQSNYRAAHCEVKFRCLSGAQIETYIDLDKPFFSAGSFKAEAAGIALFEYMKSDDPSAITGMPLIALVSLLAERGISVFDNDSGTRTK